MGLDAVISGFVAYSGLCHYAKKNNISTDEAELTQKWQEVLQAGLNRTPNERKDLDGYMYDPAGTGALYTIGKGAGRRLLDEWQLYRARVFVFDTKSDELTIQTTPGWQNLP